MRILSFFSRSFLWAFAVVALGDHLTAAEKHLPNIVFIMADDMGSGDLGCYNPRSKIPTPNMDRLAAEGIRLTDVHTPSSVCTPTRYGVLTGRYCWRTRMKRGVLGGYSRLLISTQRMTVAKLLRAKGYQTACVGKWHLGLGDRPKTDYSKPLTPGPNDVGFDYFFGIPASLDMAPYVFVENDRPLEEPTSKVAGSKHRRQNGGGFWRGGPVGPSFKHIDVLPMITKKAVGFIDRQAKQNKGKPFFLYFPLSAPHTPWLPTEAFRGKSKAGHYGDFTTQVDWTVGQIVEALKRNGMTNNTLLIVTSDNGSHWPVSDIKKFDHAANLHYRGQKADIWDGGHRVPFIARWPGKIEPKATSTQLACLTDLMASCAEIVGTKLPDDAAEDSYSLIPALLKQKPTGPVRSVVIHHSVSGMFAVRQGDWKLILGRGSGGFTSPRRVKPKPGQPIGQLYNLTIDPSEKANVYQKNPKIVARLTKLLDGYKKSGRSRPAAK